MSLKSAQIAGFVLSILAAILFLVYMFLEILYCRWRNKLSPRTRGMETVGTELERAKKKMVRTGPSSVPRGTRIWAIWSKEPEKSRRAVIEQKKAERVVDDWVERGERGKSMMTPVKPGKVTKLSTAPSSSLDSKWEDEDSEIERESQYSRGWTYPLPELMRGGKKGVRVVDEEKGGKVKKGKRVPGSWIRDV